LYALDIKKALTNQGTKGRILVVDDEPDITLTLEAGLETIGLFDVDTFNDPESAMKSFKPDYYALVLIDIMMPKMDGFHLYENLKKMDPSIKAYFLTASEMYYGVHRGVEHCALNEDLFLQKPISTDDLVKEVNKKIYSDNK
jgi:two-component system alkaline phosphatase synthesis response regulator PhoP